MAETYYTVDDPSLDMMSEENALKTLPCWLGSVLKALWQDSDPILIGGSFIPYCLGYLTWYEDIDIFMPSFIFPKFLSVFKTETGNFGHVRRNSIQSSYPESFHVYTVWIGARDTNIQLIVRPEDMGFTTGEAFVRFHVSNMDLDFGRMAMYNSMYFKSAGGVNAIEAFMRERDSEMYRSARVRKILARAAKYIARLNYMHFSQFRKPLEQLDMSEFQSLCKWKVTTIPSCVRNIDLDDSDVE